MTDRPCIVTCSISGAVANRDQCPAIPYTPEEYGAEAKRAVDEGCSMIHIHARTPDGVPSFEVEDFRAITEAEHAPTWADREVAEVVQLGLAQTFREMAAGVDAFGQLVLEESIPNRQLDSVGQIRGALEGLREARARIDELLLAGVTPDLLELHDQLSPQVAERVTYDLGLTRDLGYYSGAVFEVYDSALGQPIGGGGRYDDVVGRFGRDLPAVGWALNVERLHLAVVGEKT